MDTLSQDQLQAMIGMNKQTPDQSAMGLSHSNGIISNAINGWQQFTQPLQSFSTGFAKQELQTAQNIGQAVLSPVKAGISALTGKPAPETGIPEQMLQPQGTAEKLGGLTATGAELFAPGGVEAKAFEKATPFIEKLPEMIGLAGKGAKALTGALKTALGGLIGGTTFGGVTAAQTGDIGKGVQAAPLGAVAGGLGKSLETFGPGIIESLNKANFRLSPATEAKTTKIADNASKFLTENKITGSVGTKYAKTNNVMSQFEAVLQKSLPEGIAIQKNQIADDIRTSIEQLKQSDPAVYNQAKAKADQAINLLNSGEGNIISTKEALQSKRSWAQDAFKTAKKSKQDPTVSSEGAYAAEQAFQRALTGAFERSGEDIQIPSQLSKYFGGEETVSLPEFNKVYSDAINAKNLLFMSQFKSDSGLFGRLFGLWAGESIGQAISPGLGGKVIGGGVGEIMSTHLPGIIRNVGERALSKPGLPEAGAKLYQTTQNADSSE